MAKAIAVQCQAISKQTGRQCKRKAIPGGTVCRWHGGAAGQVKAKAAIRAEILPSGLGDSHVDPGEVLLQLVTQSAARAKRYASELEALVDEEGPAAAMVGEIEIPTKHGGYKANTSEALPSSKPRNVTAAPTSPPKQWQLASLSAKYGSPSDRVNYLRRSSVAFLTSSTCLPIRGNVRRRLSGAI
jgi:hypothetical protein